MKRRIFLKQAATVAPLIVAFNPWAVAQKSFLKKLALSGEYKNRILVLIELTGGNDGLNTVIPLDKYKTLLEARPNILIPENKILKLYDTNIFGFHPALAGLQKLYNDKLVTIIQGVGTGVGFSEAEFSHFHGINIKYTAHVGKQEIRSGWLGRYLEQTYPSYPQGYPLHPTDGPPAIEMGSVSTRITSGLNDEPYSIGVGNISDLNSISDSGDDTDPVENNFAGANINAIRNITRQISLYAPVISNFAKNQENVSKLYPQGDQNLLAIQLKTVARLIGSGLNTSVYVVSQNGYDTHGEQVDKSDPTLGKHANLLKDLSEAISAFQDDLQLMGVQDKVIGMTFSEFGRRIASSNSYGTDHGTAETVILFGAKLKNGIVGNSPDLPAKVTSADNLASQFDFRSLYATMLKDWLGVSEENVKKIITEGSADRLDLLKS